MAHTITRFRKLVGQRLLVLILDGWGITLTQVDSYVFPTLHIVRTHMLSIPYGLILIINLYT